MTARDTDLDDAIAALYQGRLGTFVDARKELSAARKRAGDKEGAARVAALGKPTPSAWATNRVSMTARQAFVDLLAIGAELRSAMRASLRGSAAGDVAALQRRMREATVALVGEAARLLAEEQLPQSEVVIGRVRQNLTTLATSGRWGDAPSACLVKDLPPLDVAALATLLDVAPERARADPVEGPAPAPSASTDGARPPPVVQVDAERERRRARLTELERALDAARATHATRVARCDAQSAVVSAREAEAADAWKRVSAAGAEVARLESELSRARDVAKNARDAADRASAEVESAKRELVAAEAEASSAERRAREATEALERASKAR